MLRNYNFQISLYYIWYLYQIIKGQMYVVHDSHILIYLVSESKTFSLNIATHYNLKYLILLHFHEKTKANA